MIQEENTPVITATSTGTDVSSLVTGLTITPTNPTSGSNVSVGVTFDDPTDQIKPDDTITVKWPTTGDAFLNAYNQTLQLHDPTTGLLLANVVVTAGSAVITFTNNVTQLHHISGTVHFKAKAWNTTSTTDANTKTIQVTCGSQSTSVSITKPEANVTLPHFYSKTGAIWGQDPDHIVWYLNTNLPKSNILEPLHISDQIQPGQSLVSDSFTIYTSSGSILYPAPNAITDFETAHPGASITYDATAGTVDITLPPSTVNGQDWIITFQTAITDKSLKTLNNDSSITYWPEGATSSQTLPSNASVASPYADGTIAGVPAGTFKIKKLLQTGPTATTPLSGIEFKLVRTDGGDITPGNTSVMLTTNADGIAQIANLPAGSYVLTEINTPAWLKPLTDPITFTISDTDTHGVYQTVTNTKKTIDVTGTKVWDSTDPVHPNIWLELYRTTATGTLAPVPNAPIKELPSGTTSVTWPGLDYADDSGNAYTYSVKEVTATGADYTPIGYTKTESGLTVTNKLQTTSVTVNKVWVDANNQDGMRPATVSVTLLANGQPSGSSVPLSGDTWSYTWSNLPLYSNGTAITYSVKETPIPGYQPTVSPIQSGVITLTNTHTTSLTSVTVNKVWVDGNNQDGIRPSKVAVTLLANGQPSGASVNLSGSTWSHTWYNLPVYQDGKEVIYSIDEEPITGYQSSASPIQSGVITLTNTHTPSVTSVTVNKVWVDANNQDGVRPSTVSVTLLANNQPTGASVTLAGNSWTYTWKNLPVNKAGKPITYSVQEANVPGYQSSASPIQSGVVTLTNTHTPGITSVTVNKVWVDANNQDGVRPTTVSATLLANGESSGSTTLTAPSWSYTWNNLPINKDGKPITYSVQEANVPGYQSSASPIQSGVVTLTNTHTPSVTSVTVNKVWVDANNQDGVRPAKVSATLLANNQPTGASVTLAAPSWSYTWNNLPLNKAGKPITYSVQETDITGYQSTASPIQSGVVTLTNTHTPGLTSVTVNKVWVDANNQDGVRPTTVSATLLANGQPSGSTTLTAPSWSYTWKNLPINKDGKPITYSVQEANVPGYQSSTSPIQSGVVTLTNTHTPSVTSVTVNKVWVDANNQDGVRPATVSATLLANNQPTGASVTLAAPSWSYTWNNLPLNKDGKPVTYSVQEIDIPGYQSAVSPIQSGVVTLTNTHTPGVTSVTVNKVWVDQDNQDGIRPTKVSVTLLANNQPTGASVNLADPSWTYTWKNLPLNKDGKPITYSVQEATISGYQHTVSPIQSGVITLTNTHIPNVTSVTVNKVWVDANNQDGIRPAKVSVTLLANNQPTGSSVDLSNPSWSYTWNNLPLNKDGKSITYSVQEITIPGYQSSASPIQSGVVTLTNTHTPSVTSVTVNKVWVDADNQDGVRPTGISVTLLANSQPTGAPVTLTAPSWSYNWKNLPLNKNGKPITYSVKEATIPGYQSSVSPIQSGVITITNTHTPGLTSVTVNKVWADQDNQDGVRPTTVSVTLLANGQPTGASVNLAAPSWSYTWKNLPIDKDGRPIIYSVQEATIPGYKSTVSPIQSGVVTLTNTHTPGVTSVTVNKVWADANNQDSLRPAKISVTLLANGQPTGASVNLTAPSWSYTWKDLPVDKDGKPITYSVKETAVPGYHTTVSPIHNGSITVTNTHTPHPHHSGCCCCCNCCNCCNCNNCCNYSNCYNFSNCYYYAYYEGNCFYNGPSYC